MFAQTFTDYEVIVVNDGSPDDTAEVLRPLAEAGRIRYIEQANAGQSQARNRGIQEARGEYIALLDDDDLWLPDKLAWQVEALSQPSSEAVMVYGATQAFGDIEFFSPEGNVPSGQAYAAFLRRNWIMSPGQTLIRASALTTISGLDASLWGVDDWDLYVRLAAVGEFVYQPQVALRYRLHGENASRDGWRMYLQSCRFQRKHFGVVPDSAPPGGLAGLPPIYRRQFLPGRFRLRTRRHESRRVESGPAIMAESHPHQAARHSGDGV